MLEHDPDKLFNLAVDAFGDYIIRTLRNRQRTATVDIKWMRWFSGNVHQALGSVMLPSDDANDVTMRLLTQLDKFIQMQHKGTWKMDYIDYFSMSFLTNSLMHPAVTHLNFLKTDTLYGYRYRHVDRMLRHDMADMNKLKVLQLAIEPRNVEITLFPNLQELTMQCDDRFLELLSVTCGNIRKLDISGSRGVTDAGVRFLVKFQHLEELNIKETSISKRGLTQLLTDLSKNKDSEGVSLLKSLGCNELDPQQLQLLVNNFQNLVKMELVEFFENCDASLLRNLKHLQSLSIDSGVKVRDILEIIGHQLKELKINKKIDACFIFKYCHSLVCLKLFPDDCSHVFEVSPHCNLKSLKVVDLTVHRHTDLACFILSNCTNVRVLKIKCYDVDSNVLATAMLQNNPLEHLEELHWWSCFRTGLLLPKVGRQIVRHCKNLEVMYGNIWWTRRRSRKPWFGKSGVVVFVQNMHHIVFKVHPRLI